MLKTRKDDLEGKACAISGSGNVASYAAKKLIKLGVKVMTLSDRSGALYIENGLTIADLKKIIDLKEVRRGELSEIAPEIEAALIARNRKAGQFVIVMGEGRRAAAGNDAYLTTGK